MEAKHTQQVTLLKDGWAKELKRQREVPALLPCSPFALSPDLPFRLINIAARLHLCTGR